MVPLTNMCTAVHRNETLPDIRTLCTADTSDALMKRRGLFPDIVRLVGQVDERLVLFRQRVVGILGLFDDHRLRNTQLNDLRHAIRRLERAQG